MQIKVFTLPIFGGEQANEELNLLLRSKKILQVESHLVTDHTGSYWSFCIRYLDMTPSPMFGEKAAKIDYKLILDEATFKRFSELREIRKQIAQKEAIPAYAVFTDEELSELAKLSELTLSKMKTIKGIGEKKVEKFGEHFVKSMLSHEASGQVD